MTKDKFTPDDSKADLQGAAGDFNPLTPEQSELLLDVRNGEAGWRLTPGLVDLIERLGENEAALLAHINDLTKSINDLREQQELQLPLNVILKIMQAETEGVAPGALLWTDQERAVIDMVGPLAVIVDNVIPKLRERAEKWMENGRGIEYEAMLTQHPEFMQSVLEEVRQEIETEARIKKIEVARFMMRFNSGDEIALSELPVGTDIALMLSDFGVERSDLMQSPIKTGRATLIVQVCEDGLIVDRDAVLPDGKILQEGVGVWVNRFRQNRSGQDRTIIPFKQGDMLSILTQDARRKGRITEIIIVDKNSNFKPLENAGSKEPKPVEPEIKNNQEPLTIGKLERRRKEHLHESLSVLIEKNVYDPEKRRRLSQLIVDDSVTFDSFAEVVGAAIIKGDSAGIIGVKNKTRSIEDAVANAMKLGEPEENNLWVSGWGLRIR